MSVEKDLGEKHWDKDHNGWRCPEATTRHLFDVRVNGKSSIRNFRTDPWAAGGLVVWQGVGQPPSEIRVILRDLPGQPDKKQGTLISGIAGAIVGVIAALSDDAPPWWLARLGCEPTPVPGCPDAGVDAGLDAGVDGGLDGGIDVGFDAGVDAEMDVGVDAGLDAGVDAPEACSGNTRLNRGSGRTRLEIPSHCGRTRFWLTDTQLSFDASNPTIEMHVGESVARVRSNQGTNPSSPYPVPNNWPDMRDPLVIDPNGPVAIFFSGAQVDHGTVHWSPSR